MGAAVMDRVLRRLAADRRRAARSSVTARLPLREDGFERDALEQELRRRFALSPRCAEHLVRAWGADAPALLEAAPEAWRRPIAKSRYLYAEIPWAFRSECAASLSDVLERRVRLALFAEGQGLPQLARIAEVAAEAQGWDVERKQAEAAAYAAAVRRRYQIVAANAARAA
jgi:glycerol-3-phosphate dehydrogenase